MTLEVAEALFLVDRLPGEELPALVVRRLEQGVDAQAIRELAGLKKPTMRDVGLDKQKHRAMPQGSIVCSQNSAGQPADEADAASGVRGLPAP